MTMSIFEDVCWYWYIWLIYMIYYYIGQIWWLIQRILINDRIYFNRILNINQNSGSYSEFWRRIPNIWTIDVFIWILLYLYWYMIWIKNSEVRIQNSEMSFQNSVYLFRIPIRIRICHQNSDIFDLSLINQKSFMWILWIYF